MIVSALLEKHFPELVGSEFTAAMERSLDEIAHGNLDKFSFLNEFYLGKSTKVQFLHAISDSML